MYEIVKGPLLWISAIIFIAGFIYRIVRLYQLTEKKDVASCPVTNPKNSPVKSMSEEEKKLEKIADLQNSVLGRHPVMTIVSSTFHFCLFLTPLFLMAHNIMFHNSFGIRLPSIPDGLADFMTIIVLGGGLFFLIRRIAIPKVAAISSGYDYVVLFITIMPYLTGFLAYHQLFDYKTIITMHIFFGDLMLMALPFTKVGHMVFFFFARLAMGGEFSLGRGNRIWTNATTTQA